MKIVAHYLMVFFGLLVLGMARAMESCFGVSPIAFAIVEGTTIADLWVPDIWIPGMAERALRRPSLINSGIVVRAPDLDAVASGGGQAANIPFLKEPDYDDEVQEEDKEPTVNKITSDKHVAPILNRVSATGHHALAGAVSGTDPVQFALNALAGVRLRQRQKTLLNILRGVFGNAAGPDAGAAALKALRKDIFIEAGAGAGAANLFSSDAFIDTLGLYGEVSDELAQRGVIVCHSKIASAMLKADDIDYFKTSEGAPLARRYKGMQIYISDLLTRAGTASGSVFDTYVFLPGAVAMGDKPQTSKIGEVSSLTQKADAGPNSVKTYDRTRFVMHVQGTRWKGVPVKQSASNAELATEGNWELAFGDVKNVSVCCLRTNG
jgi:hypothetical protein